MNNDEPGTATKARISTPPPVGDEPVGMGRIVARDATWWILGLLLIAAMALGGVHPWARTALAMGAIGALAWAWLRYAWLGLRMPIEPMGGALLLAVAWTFLQWVPLPAGLVEALAPATFQAASQAASAVGASPPDWLPLTLSPTRTALGLLTLTGYAAVFFVAADLARRRRARTLILAVEAVALLTLAVALVHAALGEQNIYGMDDYPVASPFVSPFVNPKHAGALMMLASIVALGRWLEAEARWHLGIASVLAAGVAATGSRANLGVMLAAWALLVLLASRRHVFRRRPWLPLLISVLSFAVLVLAVFPGVWSNVASTHGLWRAEIIGHWKVGAAVASEFPWLGAGMGAFPTVAAAQMSSFEAGLLDHAHSWPLQMVADWGLPVTLGVVALFAAGLARRVGALRSNLSLIGMGLALVALAVQNLVDFSAYIPGVGFAAAVVAGALAAAPATAAEPSIPVSPTSPPGPPSTSTKRWPRVSLASVEVGALLLVTVLAATHVLHHGRDAYASSAEAALADRDPARFDATTMALHHPHDYYAFWMSGRLALAANAPARAQRLLDRSLALAPRHGGVRIDMAKVAVVRRAPVTAVDHLIAAAATGERTRRRAARLVAAWPVDSGPIAQFLASDPDSALAVIRHHLLAGKLSKALAVTRRAVNFHPETLDIWQEALDLALVADDVSLFVTLTERLTAQGLRAGVYPRAWAVTKDWAAAMRAILENRPGAAREALKRARAAAVAGDNSRLLLAQADLDALEGRWDAVRQASRNHQGRTPYERSRWHQLRATAALHKEEVQEAISEFQRALVALPGDPRAENQLKRLRAGSYRP